MVVEVAPAAFARIVGGRAFAVEGGGSGGPVGILWVAMLVDPATAA